MCTQCVAGQYLTGNTCESKCSAPLFPNALTRKCEQCPYYCNQCTRSDNCMKCKSGYQQIPQDCAGEFFLKIGSSFNMSVPIQQAYTTDAFDPTEMAFEIWFKADNILSMNLEIILSLFPYKLRKKAGTAQVQLNYGDLNFCDSSNLKSNQWYHFAVSIGEETGTLNCYIDGNRILPGQTPVSTITTFIVRPREISFGAAMDKKTSEVAFNGYVKEFRWWKQQRTQFQFANFKNVAMTNIDNFQPPNKLLAYWKLDERRSLNSFSDFSSKGLVSFNPSTLNVTLADVVELREIWLKMCPEGTFVFFNETLNYFTCMKCHPDCQNCNGATNTSCTSCSPPFKLLVTEQKCIISLSCPKGYWMDKNQDCWPCHPYCADCYQSDQFSCTACNKGFFKAYKRAGCVDSCPRGLYGNYLTQSCSANPIVKSIYPDDGLVIPYGTFIDLYATFSVLNDEPRNTYWYNWTISKLNSNMDIASDAAKPYAGQDILRVHLDNNIIEPNNYYNITFFVKGNNTVYNGMLGSMYNIIYIGIPPKGGSCTIKPQQGIATVTSFDIRTQNWRDPDGISEFTFFYSIDEGKTYLPIPQTNYKNQFVNYKFDTVYMTQNARLKCQVKSMKGFLSSAETTFVLTRRSTSISKSDLQKMVLTDVVDEGSSMRKAYQIYQVAQDIGSLKVPDVKTFDKRVEPEQCTEQLCSFNGQCNYDTFQKKYYCQCNGARAGLNCTFKNETDLNALRSLTLQNMQLYFQFSINKNLLISQSSRLLLQTQTSTSFDYQFLKVISSYTDLMSDDLFDKIHDLVFLRVLYLKEDTSSSLDESLECMQILSNMLEYIDYDLFTNNQTGSWKGKDANQTGYLYKVKKVKDNLARTMFLVGRVRNATLYKLSFLQKTIQMSTRKISYKQMITSQESILSMPATEGIKKRFSTFMRISPANFQSQIFSLNTTFIAEAVEYSLNPYQIENIDRIATNIYEANFYNQIRTTTENIITKVQIEDMQVPIEFSFPSGGNHNLTEFFKYYNALSPYKNEDRVKRTNMVQKSNLTCVSWNVPAKMWTKQGCQLSTIDTTHVKCLCDHLSTFAVQFATPILQIEAPLLNNSTVQAQEVQERALTLDDIIRWPLDKYFENMQELWQHKRPSFLSFILKPGIIVLGLFWAMYLSSLIYYSGRDDVRRYNMTKSQNRDDLAELNDNEVQNLSKVIRDLIVRDFLAESGRYIQMQARKAPILSKKQMQPPQIKIQELMSKEDQKKYKQRARRKVFGVPAGLCQRAERQYQRTMKYNKVNPNDKMSFFNEELKNNFWIGLIAKTSKIAPRHVRLVMMYLYAALYISILTIIFAFQLQECISSNALFQVIALSLLCHLLAIFITIPVAVIFRMPMSYCQLISGVRTKKVNKAFKEIDKLMGCRYAIGYFICFSFYVIMTVLVLVFSLFYPQDYVTGWAFNIILLYLLDLIVFSFGLASIQMTNVIISTKVKCWYKVWAVIEVFRYLKNLKG